MDDGGDEMALVVVIWGRLFVVVFAVFLWAFNLWETDEIKRIPVLF